MVVGEQIISFWKGQGRTDAWIITHCKEQGLELPDEFNKENPIANQEVIQSDKPKPKRSSDVYTFRCRRRNIPFLDSVENKNQFINNLIDDWREANV